MQESKENPWSSLLHPAAGEVGSRRVNAKSKYELYFSQDHAQKYMFVFALTEPPAAQEGVSLNGISIFHTQVHKSPAIVLSLKDNQDWPIFLKICLDLYDIIEPEKSEKKAVGAFYNRLRYWQYFLKRNAEDALSREEQIGLIGELLILEKCILPNHKALDAVNFWTGAEDDVQDFSIGKNRIEVKACASPSKNEVFISSLEQLYNEKCPIYLTVAYLGHAAADAEDAVSLFSLAERIAGYVKKQSVSAYESFIQKLSLRGLFLDGSYNDAFYILSSFKIFCIRDEFPRIVPPDVRHGVSQAKYSINLSFCTDYEVSVDAAFKKD